MLVPSLQYRGRQMVSDPDVDSTGVPLRIRALSRLIGGHTPPAERLDPSVAFQALYELALSPSTAPRALALLHELQVHQVELELQEEELRRSRAELESTVIRQAQLYDCAPVALFTVGRSSEVIEFNATGARLLGIDGDALRGASLDAFLAADSALALRSMLTRLGAGAVAESCSLQVVVPDGAPRSVLGSASLDPAGPNFLVALVRVGEDAA